jgi:hypothetical protein
LKTLQLRRSEPNSRLLPLYLVLADRHRGIAATCVREVMREAVRTRDLRGTLTA